MILYGSSSLWVVRLANSCSEGEGEGEGGKNVPDKASWLMQGLQRERHAQTNQKTKTET